MFEKYLENLLQSILGQYIDGLDQQSLKVGIWSGEAKIENLKLKADALLKFNLPFLVKYSRLGTLNLNIPWKNLAGAPLKANLDTLYLIVTPQTQNDWKFGSITGADKLCEIDAFKKKLLERLQNKEQPDGMVSRIIIRVIENLQVKINNIHIRIEDGPISYGFILQNFSLLTVNESGVEQFIDRTANKNQFLIKTLQISNIGLYWQWKNGVKYDEQKFQESVPQSDYLFRMSLTSKVVQPPKQNEGLPDFKFEIELDAFDIIFSKPQVQQILNLVDYMNQHNRAKILFQKNQQQILPLDEETRQKFEKTLRSIPLEKKIQESLNKDQNKEFCFLLEKASIDELKPLVLQIVKDQQYEDMKQKALKKKQPQGFLSGWFGRNKQQQQQNETPTLMAGEEEEITQFLEQNFQMNENQANTKPTSIQVTGRLKKGTISLRNPRLQEVDEFTMLFEDLNCELSMEKDLKIDLSLIDMQVLFNQHSFLINMSKEKTQPIFMLKFNLIESINTQIELITRSSKLRFVPDVITVLQDFSNVELKNNQIKQIADDQIQELKQNAQVALANQVVAEQNRSVNITMNQFYLEIPLPNSNESWIFCPGLVQINSSIENNQEKYSLKISDINFKHQSTIEYAVIDDFTIGIDIYLPNQMNPNMRVCANVNNIITNLNPKMYQKLTQIGDCFVPTVQIDNQNIKIVDAETEKNNLVSQALKIGPLYLKEGQLNQWTKYTCVLSGSYLYFYSTPKALQPTHMIYVKNAQVILKGVDEFKMNILQIQNEAKQSLVGVNSQGQINGWIDNINSLKDKEEQLLEQLIQKKQDEQVKSIEYEKFITFNIMKVVVNLQDSKCKQFISLQTNGLNLKLTTHPQIIQAYITLQSIMLQDSLRQYANPDLQNFMISQQDNSELIQINYIQIDRNHPEYKNVDKQIDLAFGQFKINFKSETFAYLMQFMADEQLNDQQQQQQQVEKLDKEFIEAEREYILLKLGVKINSITFNVIHEITKLSFFDIRFENSCLSMSKSQDELRMEVRLGNLQINDLSNYPKTLTFEEDFQYIQPCQIIGIKELGESLLEVKIAMIEPLSKKAQSNRNLLDIDAKISSIVADYQQQPVLRIIDYLTTLQEPFTNPFSFKIPGYSIDQVIKQKKMTNKIQVEPSLAESQIIVADPPKMKLNVQISNPQIIIRNKFSNEYMIFNLGNISVTNEKVLVNRFFKEIYIIQISKLNLTGDFQNNKSVIASDFNLDLRVTLPDLVPFYKSLNMKPSETIEIDSEMSQFILSIDGSTFKLINRLVAYNFTLNDSFNEFVLLNTEKSNQISQEEQKIILKQDVEKKIRSSDYFLKFNLKINNISIFLCLDRPLMRLSIVESKVIFNMKKDNKKEIQVQINSFNSCVYELVNAYYVSKPLIGIQAETKYETLEDLSKLIPKQYYKSKESGSIEMFINPTQNKVQNKMYLKFESLLLTVQTKILLQALSIFESENLEPYVNTALQEFQQRYDDFLKTQQKEEESQPIDSQFFITLGDVVIALPSKNDSILIITGKFDVIVNQYDTMSFDELFQIIKQQGLNEYNLIAMNFKQKSTVSIEGVQAFVASKQWLYSPDAAKLEYQRQLICPFTMLLNHTLQLVMSENFDCLQDKQEIRLSLSQFSIKISFQDILFIQSQLNSQLQIINELARNDVNQQRVSVKQPTQDQMILSLELVLDGINICILNDIENYYQYILNFRLFQNDIKIQQLPTSTKLSANFPLQLTYFNSSIGLWEPVIEKFDININYQKQLQKSNKKDYEEINVSINDNINLNISTQLVQTIVPTLNLLMEQLQIENKNIRWIQTSQAKYALYNQFGSDIVCETQDSKFIIAQQNEYKPFDVKQQETNSFIKLQIQGERNPFEIEGWNIDKLQNKIHKTKQEVKVLIQNIVDPIRNSKIIYVSSEYIIQNNTQTQLDIVFQNQQGQKYKYNLQTFFETTNQVTIQPHQLVIPQFLCQSEFYICKSANNKEKSKPYNVQYLKQCFQSREVLKLWLSENFILFLSACKDLSFNGRTIIYIQPYFRLQNLLPFPVKITTHFENRIGGQYELKTLEYLDEHQYQNIKESHAIQIDIDSYKRSALIPLLNSRNFKQQQNVINLVGEEWQGSNGGKSELILEYNYGVYDKTGLCTAILYAQELLKNETQYELVVFQGRNNQLGTIGGLKKGSKNRMLILNNSTINNELVFSERETPQVCSLTIAQINSIGISTSDLIFRKNGLFYIAPLSVQSELKFIQSTCQKIVTVRNRIIIVNDSDISVCIKQNFAAKEINPRERQPLEIDCGDVIPQNADKIYNLYFTYLDGNEWDWSGVIECNQIGVYYFQLRSKKFNIRKFAQVDINEKNGVLFVVISETEQEKTPYKITNSSNLIEITVLNIPVDLETDQECYFAWDDPNVKNTVDLQIRSKIPNFEALSYSLNINKITENKFFILSPLNKQDPHKIYIKLTIEIDGYTRHAQFFDSSEEELNKIKEGEKNKQIATESNLFKFDIMINQINLNLIDNHKNYPQEIVNIILYQSEAIMLTNQQNKGVFQFKIQGLQIDNTTQLFPQFPVILTLQPTGKIKQQFPMLNILVQMNLKAKQLQMIEKFSIETNRLALKINEEFIKTLISTTNKITQLLNDQQLKIIPQNFDWKKCELPNKLIPTYFGSFSIYPINVSITVQWGRRDKEKDQESFLLTSTLSGVGFQFVSVDEAEINLKGINMENVFDSVNGLSKRIMNCYLPNLYQQLPAILGSLAVIGNPAKLLKNFATGFQDLVERPIEGFTKGPLEGGMGIVSGASSLVSNTVSGVFNSVKNVVGTISSGLTKVTMDQTYQEERQVQNSQQAKNLGSGLAEGSKSLAKGVAGGVFGFFSKPVQGLQQGGASGFIKGVWQGTSGLVIKPVTGVLDVITKTSEGVKNQLSSDEQSNNNRIRYLRPFYESDGYFKEYNWIDAECFEVIQGVKKGKYSHHRLIRVIIIEKDKKQFALIVTDLSVILFDLTTHLKLWSILYSHIEAIDSKDKDILIKIKESKKAFGGKQITQLSLQTPQQSKQIVEEIRMLKQI